MTNSDCLNFDPYSIVDVHLVFSPASLSIIYAVDQEIHFGIRHTKDKNMTIFSSMILQRGAQTFEKMPPTLPELSRRGTFASIPCRIQRFLLFLTHFGSLLSRLDNQGGHLPRVLQKGKRTRLRSEKSVRGRDRWDEWNEDKWKTVGAQDPTRDVTVKGRSEKL